jgi:hypothetical protein
MTNRWWKGFAAILLAVGLGLSWVTFDQHAAKTAYAGSKAPADDTKAGKVSDDHRKVLEAAAPYLYGESSPITLRLKQLGYEPPPALAANWERVPDLQKLSYAYAAAKEANPRDGGQRFLALMSADLSRQAPDNDNPLLKEYVNQAKDDKKIAAYLAWRYGVKNPDEPPPDPPLSFANPKPDGPPPAAPPQVMKVLREIEKYSTTGVLPWSESTILTHFFKVTNERADELLLTQRTFLDAMVGAIQDRAVEEHPKILTHLVTAIHQEFPMIDDHPVLKPWISRKPPDVTDAGPRRGPPEDPPPTRPKTPAREAEDVTAEKRHERSMENTYEKPEDRKFEEMGTKVKDFGGGVFGNEVKADGLPKPLRMQFQPGKDNLGTLLFEFAGDKSLKCPNVRSDDAWAAGQIVFAGNWSPGDGIGLVGQKETGIHWVLSTAGLDVLRKSEIVLHPTLVNTELGHAALMVDSIPQRAFQPWLAAMRREPKVVRETIEKWAKSRADRLAHSNYVLTDVPIELSESDGGILLTANPPDAENLPLALRRAAFVELRLQTDVQAEKPEDRYDREFAREFYRVVPQLERASYDMRRINRFASVLALFRWAKEKQIAECDGLPRAKPRARQNTPDAIAERFDRRGDDSIRATIVRVIKEGVTPVYMPIRSLNEENELKDRARRADESVQRMNQDKTFQALLRKTGVDEERAEKELRKTAEKDIQEANDQIADWKKNAKVNEWSKEKEWSAFEFLTLDQVAGHSLSIQRELDQVDWEIQDEIRVWYLLNYAKMQFQFEVELRKK